MKSKSQLIKLILRALSGPIMRMSATTKFIANLITKRILGLETQIKQVYTFQCFDRHGKLKWVDTIENLVVDEGLTDMLQVFYNSAGYTAAHYVLLTNADPVFAPGDTMGAHPGWTENTAYIEAARPTLQMGTAANKQIDNSANKASYTINADSQTIGGAGVSDDATKGGATGLLVGGGAFTQGNKPVDSGDQLLVTVQATNSST